MQLTTRRRIPYPDLNGDDTPVDLPQLFHDRAVILDKGVDIDSGTLSARPVSTGGTPGIAGRQYIVTDQADSPRLDLDIGVGWVTVGPAPVDGAANIPSLRTLGTGHQQAVAGDDARLIGGGNASGDLTGVYPGPMTVASWNGQSKAAVVAGNPPQTHGSSHRPAGTDPVTNLTDASIAAANIDGAAGTPSMRTLGGGGQQAMAGNATPTPGAHAASHKYAGADPLVSLTPTLKNANYVAAVGDLVIMSGSNNVITLPNAPAVDGAQCAVLAVTAAVTVNRAGTDTITTTSQGQLTISVAQGTSVVFTYHSGVWYGLVSGSGGGATGLVPLSPPSRAYRASAQSVGGGWTKVQIDTKSFDPTGIFDVTTNYRCVIQTAGYYQIDASVCFSIVNNNDYTMGVYKNGSVAIEGTQQWLRNSTLNDPLTVVASDVIQLNAGDILELWAYASTNPTNLAIGAPYLNNLSVVQVAQIGSPPAGQGMGVVARAYPTANTPISGGWTNVSLNATSFDPNSSFQGGKYVCPATGYYHVSGNIAMSGAAPSGTSQLAIGISHNVTPGAVQGNSQAIASGAGNGTNLSVDDIIFCQAGDTLGLQVYWPGSAWSASSGATVTYMSVVQVAGSATFGALSPTAQSAPYTAGAGQLVLMTGANAVTLPTGPVPGSQVEVMALTAQVPVNRGGTDTINNAGVAGQQSVTVNAGQAIIFSYLGGVWYASPVGGGQSLPPSARAYASTAQVFGAGAAAAKLLIDTKAFDPGGNFDTTNHRYVAPVAGFYHVDVNALFTVGATGTYTQLYVQIQKNGATQAETGSEFATEAFMGATLSDVIQMNAGDYLEVWCQSIGQAATVDPSYVLNYMSVHPIGVIGAPTPGQGQTTVARAYRNAAFNLTSPLAKITCDSKSYDPGNNLPTADRYICPTTGYYEVSASVQVGGVATGNIVAAAVAKNGTAVVTAYSDTSGASVTNATVTDVVSCQAGDYIELFGYCSVNGAAGGVGSTATFFAVRQIAGANLVGALSPTAQSTAYSAGAGQRVLMTGANTVTLPNAPMAGSTVAVNALTGVVPVNRSGSDTITRWGTAGLASLSVAPGSSVELQYLSGVWYVIRGLETKPRGRAAVGIGQTVATGANAAITGLTAAANDTAGGVAISGNGFSVPVAGYYRVNAQITLQPPGAAAAGSYMQLSTAVNGTGTGITATQPVIANSSYPTANYSDILHLNAGDVVTLILGQNASGITITVNSAQLVLEYVSQ